MFIKNKIISLGLAASLLLPAVLTTVASASIEDLTVQTGCTDHSSYTAVLSLDAGEYDTYVRLSKRGERATVSVYSQSQDQSYGDCTQLGKIKASSQTWAKAGTVTAPEDSQLTIELSSPSLVGVPDANRPAVMLVPKGGVCRPTTECYVNIANEQAYLRPPGTLKNQNSLYASVVVDPSDDAISSVRYYAGKNLQYTTEQLEDFDNRYIEYAGQPLTRVIEYVSGQQAVIESKASLSHTDTFGNYLFRLTQRYPGATSVMLWVSAAVILIGSILLLVRFLVRRHERRIHYGFAAERQLTKFELLLYSDRVRNITKFTKPASVMLGLVALTMVAIVVVNNYALQIITVDGESMQRTYFTGDKVLVNKLPKTMATLNNREFIPERGQVVIVRMSFGRSVLSGEVDTGGLLIKRVLALPGERAVVKDGVLTVYSRQSPEGFSPDIDSPWSQAMTPDAPTDNIDIQLEEGEIFISGDNRPASIDSRFNGALGLDEVVGVVGWSF